MSADSRQQHAADRWLAATAYQLFMGRWSRSLAHVYVDWLNAEPGRHWLDVGCGTGSLTAAICDDADPASVVACDPAESFINYAKQQIQNTRVSFVVAGADDFPLRPDGYDVIASLLALNFFPKPQAAVSRMTSAVVNGGIVSACVWDYSKGMQFLRYFWDAATAIVPGAEKYDEGNRFPLCTRSELEKLFKSAGLLNVKCEPIEIPTRFDSFDDYWTPLLGATGPAPTFLASLDEPTRARVRGQLEKTLPTAAGGGIDLTARAWAVRGQRA